MLMRLLYHYVTVISDSVPQSLLPYWNTLKQFILSIPFMADWQYFTYLAWLFTPIVISFLIPVLLCLILYCNALFLHMYGLRHKLYQAYAHSYWDGARSALASFWDAQGRIWHGYELEGLENIPDTGPALIVYYHGTLPLDVYYLLAKCILYKNRTVHCVGDKFLFKVPGLGICLKVFCVTPGSVDSCVQDLSQGNLLCISPGGVREALFADQNYPIMWAKRLGFARIALRTQVPVIPMFTENCRESIRSPTWGRSIFRWIYEKTRLPLVPLYGGFPVKMKTHIGAPIMYTPLEYAVPIIHDNPIETVDNDVEDNDIEPSSEHVDNSHTVHNPIETAYATELRQLCEARIRDMILKHQRTPGSITKGIMDRIPAYYRRFKVKKEEEWNKIVTDRCEANVDASTETDSLIL